MTRALDVDECNTVLDFKEGIPDIADNPEDSSILLKSERRVHSVCIVCSIRTK